MMNLDKFLTDLAALTGCDGLSVYYDTTGETENSFSLYFYKGDYAVEGIGPTVEAAMQEACVKLAKHTA